MVLVKVLIRLGNKKKMPHNKTNYYHAYGLCFKSSITFPGVVSKKAEPDVLICFDRFRSFPGKNEEYVVGDYTKVKVCPGRIDLFWKDIFICSVNNGNEVVINPSTGLDNNLLRTIIWGTAIAFILHQRGMVVLHANAVNINGNAVAFIGPQGIGKSTISIFLHNIGYGLISDDILCVNIGENNNPFVFSDFRMLKFWPDIINFLGKTPESIPQVNSSYKKHLYKVDGSFDETLPLRAIYLIEKGSKTVLKKMDLQKSFAEIIKSFYCARLFNNNELLVQLKQSAFIAEKVPVKTLRSPGSFKDLPKIADIILQDLIEKP